MQTQSPHWRLLVLPLAFAFGCLVLALITWRSFGGDLPLQPKGYRVEVPLRQAPNLFAGADVRMSGVTIGEVVAVRREGTHALVTAELDSRYAPLRAGAGAVLRSKTLLGEGFLQLSPGPVTAAPIPEGGRLAAANVRDTQRLDDVLQTFDAPTRRKTRALLAGMAGAFATRGADINSSLGQFAPISVDLRGVLDTLDGQRDDVSSVIADSGTVLDALGRRSGTIQAAITQTQRVLATTASRDRRLAQTVHALPPFLGQLQATAAELRAARGDLDGATAALRPVSAALGPAVAQVDRVAPSLRRTFTDLPPVLRAADRGLPGLERVLDASGPAFGALHPALRETLPVLQIFGLVRDSLITTLASVGQIHNGTYVGPGQRVGNYANGVITVWNESVGGWAKRLPTNRSNTYPKPDFLTKIATGLESYDCRHTGNPNYLPALGGAPPCKTQGAWTYAGRTRFYPHLRRSPP